MGKRTIINFVAVLVLIAAGLGVSGILPKLGALNAQTVQAAQTGAPRLHCAHGIHLLFSKRGQRVTVTGT